jgi:hypothetical protein
LTNVRFLVTEMQHIMYIVRIMYVSLIHNLILETMKTKISKVCGFFGIISAIVFFLFAILSITPLLPHNTTILYTFYASAIGMVYFGGAWMAINFK